LGAVFERFTERARQAVVLAQGEARALKHNYLGTEHLLLGLLRADDGVAARVLESLGVTLEEARAQVARIVGQGDEITTGQIPFTKHATRALDLAQREALSLGHNYIGTEHILLGVVRENEVVGVRILLDFDADAEKVRDEVIRILGGPGPRQTDEGFPPGEGSDVELVLRRVVPVAQQFSDGTWIVSLEVWDHCVVLRYAISQRPHRPPLGGSDWHGWLISDDLGTEYARVGAGGGGSLRRGYHGDAHFEPAPPSTATILQIRHERADGLVSVSLTD
jgi:hypothetical protein